jgi:hypothetical protein
LGKEEYLKYFSWKLEINEEFRKRYEQCVISSKCRICKKVDQILSLQKREKPKGSIRDAKLETLLSSPFSAKFVNLDSFIKINKVPKISENKGGFLFLYFYIFLFLHFLYYLNYFIFIFLFYF